ncbi:DNA-3-methyladenine glycosylase 2 family protein [Actinomycetospora lutea]|uniref:DNA-3-methyladenine glycosylase family protein n=1 Tax=Actinomycetospora lutea TaxID=663604 RepID=UPI002365893F|nr:DNA-3-methyladenine glycosylase 2 family protein [Actinomycetospora lutea]MDD7938254.1 DNA-3-methyladenine glycosylase 2 family protein [Actinomycetospora lutea]
MTAALATGVLEPLGPFDLEQTRAFVGRWGPITRHAPSAGEPLRLTAPLDGDQRPVAVALRQAAPDGPVEVEIAGAHAAPDRALAQVARLLSLDHDARDYPDVGRRVPAIGRLMAAHPGLRPTLFGTPYEAAAWSVVSARIGERQAGTVFRRLAAAHGETLTVAGAEVDAFPGPEALRAVEKFPGLDAEKVRRLHGVADAALAGDLEVDRLRALGPDGARAALTRLRGIGDFGASLIWLRSCGVVDEWPDGEPRCRAALARLHGRHADDPLDDLIDGLRPYRTWAALLLRVARHDDHR